MGDLDPIIHQPARLRIMSALTTLGADESLDFTWLRKELELTEGNLGAHLLKLEEAGYIKVVKKFVGRRPKTLLSASHKGRAAFEEHVAEHEGGGEGEPEAEGAR